jgi:hypothetical protein
MRYRHSPRGGISISSETFHPGWSYAAKNPRRTSWIPTGNPSARQIASRILTRRPPAVRSDGVELECEGVVHSLRSADDEDWLPTGQPPSLGSATRVGSFHFMRLKAAWRAS